MSTTVEETRHEHSRQYAEFDEYIDFQLQRLRSGIRTNDVFTALCGIAVIVTGYLLAFVVLDHWVIDGGFSHSTRLVSMLLLIAGTSAWVALRVIRPCLRRVNRLYAARLAENSSEELDSNLLN
jgi:collagen type III alpha